LWFYQYPIIGNIIKCQGLHWRYRDIPNAIQGSEILDQFCRLVWNNSLPSLQNPYSASYLIHKNYGWQILKDYFIIFVNRLNHNGIWG
jgi:hypothetical protein